MAWKAKRGLVAPKPVVEAAAPAAPSSSDQDEKEPRVKLEALPPAQAVIAAPAPVALTRAPLRKPKKWVASVYEMIGTPEFQGAPFLGTFVEHPEHKGRVFCRPDGTLFLYYWRPKRQWIIGNNFSTELGLCCVSSLARSPDEIARPWSFYEPELGEWETTENLLLRRLPTPQEAAAWAASRDPLVFELRGPAEKYHDAPFIGKYEELVGYSPPVYRHVASRVSPSSAYFMYYWKLKRQWIVGRDWRTDVGAVMFCDGDAETPDRLTTYWTCWDPDTREWTPDADVWCPRAGADSTNSTNNDNSSAEDKKKAVELVNAALSKSASAPASAPVKNSQSDAPPTPADTTTKRQARQILADRPADRPTTSASAEASMDPSDSLDMFMKSLGSAKTEEEIAAALGARRRRRKRRSAAEGGAIRERLNIDEVATPEEINMARRLLAERARSARAEKAKPKLKDLKPVDHSKVEYEDFRKKFYIEAPDIAAMTPDQVKAYCKERLDNVRVRGRACPKPIKRWTHCGLPRKVYRTLERLGYTAPFPIQATAIPAIMSGRDVIGIAKTGSGKTLAFLLPMLRHVIDQRPLEKGEGPISVILAPTRELVVQIHFEVKKFTKTLGIRPVVVYGGSSIAEQIAELKRGAEIVTATPGRLIDLLCANSGRVTNLTRVTYLVLDEADRMFDLGFEPQIMRIVQNVRPNRQTVMFSATFPRAVEKLAKLCMRIPVEIMIGGRSVATTDVKQFVEVREKNTRFARLLEVLGKWYSKGSILIFANKKDDVDYLFTKLIDAGYPCLTVHGGMDQTDRDFAILDFRNGLRTLMVATSIIARGLDVKNLVLVINYDAPTHYEDYVHRIGRTGRAGRKGTAITFLGSDDEQLSLDLVKGLRAAKQIVPKDVQQMAENFKAKVKRGEASYYANKGYSGRGHTFDAQEAAASANERRWERIGWGVEEKTDDDYVAEEERRQKEKEKKEAELAAMTPLQRQMLALKKAALEAKKAIKKSGGAGGGGKALLAARNAVQTVIQASRGGPDSGDATGGRGSGGSTLQKRGDFYLDEIEINDIPQYSRYKVTQKSIVSDIEERTECTITSKGQYIPPGRKPKNGERKLWLLIEGRTQIAVMRCKAEIRRVIDEAAALRPDTAQRRSGGKYQVLSIGYK